MGGARAMAGGSRNRRVLLVGEARGGARQWLQENRLKRVGLVGGARVGLGSDGRER